MMVVTVVMIVSRVDVIMMIVAMVVMIMTFNADFAFTASADCAHIN